MARTGLLLCVCRGTCPSFQEMNIFDVANAIRREELVDYVGIHPQLCARDGDQYLITLLKGSDTDRLYVAACAPEMQMKMFRDAFREAGFDEENLKGVDIRNMSTEQAIAAIKQIIVGEKEAV